MKRLIPILFLLFVLVSCEAPNISVERNPGTDIIAAGQIWTDSGCVIHINEDVYDMTRITNLDTSVLGETTVEYEYLYKEDTYICKRVVKVVDVTSPNVTLNPGVDTITVGEAHVDGGITASDNFDQELEIEIDNQVDTTQQGTYTITYTVTDDFDNETILIRYVHVIVPVH